MIMVPSSHVRATARASGIECETGISSRSNGPASTWSPALHLVERHVLELVLLDLRARHRDRQRGAVDRGRISGPRSRRIHGRAPTWSSWPCVSTIASMSVGALAQVREVGQHEVDPQLLGGREHQARVDHDDAPVVLDAPSCSCRSRPARRAGGRAGCRSRARRAAATRPSGAPAPARTRQPRRVAAARRPSRSRAGPGSLDRRGRRRDEERAVHLLELAVERPRALHVAGPCGLVQLLHLLAGQVRGHGDAARAPDLGERPQQVVVTGVQGQLRAPPRSAAPASMSELACFTPDDVVDPPQLGRAGPAPG